MNNKEYSPEEYEQALENVRAEWGTSDRDIDILQELVDRATPKTLVEYQELNCVNYLCPICENKYNDSVNNRKYIKYCPICGQKLLWE